MGSAALDNWVIATQKCTNASSRSRIQRGWVLCCNKYFDTSWNATQCVCVTCKFATLSYMQPMPPTYLPPPGLLIRSTSDAKAKWAWDLVQNEWWRVCAKTSWFILIHTHTLRCRWTPSTLSTLCLILSYCTLSPTMIDWREVNCHFICCHRRQPCLTNIFSLFFRCPINLPWMVSESVKRLFNDWYISWTPVGEEELELTRAREVGNWTQSS